MKFIISILSSKSVRWVVGILFMLTMIAKPSLSSFFIALSGLSMIPFITSRVYSIMPIKIGYKALISVSIFAISGFFADKNANNIDSDNVAQYQDSVRIVKKARVLDDVENTISAINSIGYGDMTEWKLLEDKYFCFSDYYSFGSMSSKNGMQNNLSYQFNSTQKTKVEEIEMILHINNPKEYSDAVSLFLDATKKTFDAINENMPKELIQAYRDRKNIKCKSSDMTVILEIEKTKIDTWILKINNNY